MLGGEAIVEHVDDVAAAFIDQLGAMPAMKLQKLVYYAQAWSLARTGTPMFDQPIEAWAQGPVVDRLFQQHIGLRYVRTWTSGRPERLSDGARDLIAWVAQRYGHLSGDELSEMTHRERPWCGARGRLAPTARTRRPIAPHVMADYYRQVALSGAEAVSHVRANARAEGIEFSAQFEGVLAEVSAGRQSTQNAVNAIVARHARHA